MLQRECIRLLLSRFFEPEIATWRSETNLATPFYGILASAALIMLHASDAILRQVALQQVLIIASAFYALWMLVAILRCASRAHPEWSTLARSLRVARALGFVLAFLQLGLLIQPSGA